jgi:hypothetical protein
MTAVRRSALSLFPPQLRNDRGNRADTNGIPFNPAVGSDESGDPKAGAETN